MVFLVLNVHHSLSEKGISSVSSGDVTASFPLSSFLVSLSMLSMFRCLTFKLL